MGKSYVERTEEIQDQSPYGFPFGSGEANTAKPMLERTDTNRILVSDRQAILLNLIGLHHDVLLSHCKTTEFKKLIEGIGAANHLDVQTAQLTRDSMSREDYIKIAAAKLKKKTGLTDAFSHKQGSSNSTDSEGDD